MWNSIGQHFEISNGYVYGVAISMLWKIKWHPTFLKDLHYVQEHFSFKEEIPYQNQLQVWFRVLYIQDKAEQ